MSKFNFVENPHPWKESKNLLELFVRYEKHGPNEMIRLMEMNVSMTEKIDGSNISIGFNKNGNKKNWLVRICSRRIILLEFVLHDLELIQFPTLNGKCMDFMRPKIPIFFDLLKSVKEFEEPIKEGKWVYFVGEIYFENYEPALAKGLNYGSDNWYGFGLIVEKEPTVESQTLAMSYILNEKHRELLKQVGIALPEIKYQGPLYLGIKAIDELLKTNRHEGVVIQLDQFSCVKYKSPRSEEQVKLKLETVPVTGKDEIDQAIKMVIGMFELSQKLQGSSKKIKIVKKKKKEVSLSAKSLSRAYQSLKNPRMTSEIMEHLKTHMPVKLEMSDEVKQVLYSSYLNELSQKVDLDVKTLDEITRGKLLLAVKKTVDDYLN